MAPEREDRQLKLIELLQQAIQLDVSLREKHQIGDKFRFIKERLQALDTRLNKELESIRAAQAAEQKIQEEAANDVLVYVYLYNAQGVVLRSWLNMLTPKVFYEYSINRPIYADRNIVDAIVRSKPNKMQHAYLTVAINPDHITPANTAKPLQDAAGNSLLRVKEGSLRFEKLVSLMHNGEEYVLNARGELVKK